MVSFLLNYDLDKNTGSEKAPFVSRLFGESSVGYLHGLQRDRERSMADTCIG